MKLRIYYNNPTLMCRKLPKVQIPCIGFFFKAVLKKKRTNEYYENLMNVL
jgi:hypothetical protein